MLDAEPSMVAASSLSFLTEVANTEVATQERRADALDSKAGVLLGFAGVVVTLTLANLKGIPAELGAVMAGLAGAFAAWAFLPRKTPALSLRTLRDSYLAADEEFTKLRLLDTRISMYQLTETVLRTKAHRIKVATVLLGIAIVLTVVGGIVSK